MAEPDFGPAVNPDVTEQSIAALKELALGEVNAIEVALGKYQAHLRLVVDRLAQQAVLAVRSDRQSVADVPAVAILSWDWRQQPPLDELARLVRDMSGGRVHLTEVEDTGTDEYVLLVSSTPLGQQEAAEVYRRWWTEGERA